MDRLSSDAIQCPVRKRGQPHLPSDECCGRRLGSQSWKGRRLSPTSSPVWRNWKTDFQQALEAEKLEAMAEFAAGAGHEINNPLTVISGRAQLLLREETDPERRHALALISAQAMRVYEMIADMMLFARPPGPNSSRSRWSSWSMNWWRDLLPRCARQETSIRRRRRVGTDFHRGRSRATSGGVAGDMPKRDGGPSQRRPHRDRRGKDRGAGGSLAAAGTAGGEVKIRIRDDGPGIKPEERRHMFDPFYSARQAGRGLGLGLSKAWRIVTNHGGRIEVSSPAGHGATVTRRAADGRLVGISHHAGNAHSLLVLRRAVAHSAVKCASRGGEFGRVLGFVQGRQGLDRLVDRFAARPLPSLTQTRMAKSWSGQILTSESFMPLPPG